MNWTVVHDAVAHDMSATCDPNKTQHSQQETTFSMLVLGGMLWRQKTVVKTREPNGHEEVAVAEALTFIPNPLVLDPATGMFATQPNFTFDPPSPGLVVAPEAPAVPSPTMFPTTG